MPLDDPFFSQVYAIIPVRDEAAAIAPVIAALQAQGVVHIVVVDNGSRDDSGAIAQAAGAVVVYEPKPGYGRACWTGLQQLPVEAPWVLFCDGDGSDDLSGLPEFWAAAPTCDLVLGDRRATAAGRSVLTPVQRFGNWLATGLMHLGWGYRYRDLGPLRLIQRSALDQMQMQDRGFGWTVEMQVRAIELGLCIRELPVGYRPRQGGRSKISGTVSGSIQAGVIILQTLGRLYWRRWRGRVRPHQPQLPQRR